MRHTKWNKRRPIKYDENSAQQIIVDGAIDVKPRIMER